MSAIHDAILLDMLFDRCRDMMLFCVEDSEIDKNMIGEIASEIKIIADELEKDG